jgi:hypothetical protein
MDKDMTQEQKAAKAWFDYCFEYKDGPYSIIQEFQQALIKRVEEMNREEDYFKNWTTGDIIQLIKETEPIKQ